MKIELKVFLETILYISLLRSTIGESYFITGAVEDPEHTFDDHDTYGTHSLPTSSRNRYDEEDTRRMLRGELEEGIRDELAKNLYSRIPKPGHTQRMHAIGLDEDQLEDLAQPFLERVATELSKVRTDEDMRSAINSILCEDFSYIWVCRLMEDYVYPWSDMRRVIRFCIDASHSIGEHNFRTADRYNDYLDFLRMKKLKEPSVYNDYLHLLDPCDGFEEPLSYDDHFHLLIMHSSKNVNPTSYDGRDFEVGGWSRSTPISEVLRSISEVLRSFKTAHLLDLEGVYYPMSSVMGGYQGDTFVMPYSTKLRLPERLYDHQPKTIVDLGPFLENDQGLSLADKVLYLKECASQMNFSDITGPKTELSLLNQDFSKLRQVNPHELLSPGTLPSYDTYASGTHKGSSKPRIHLVFPSIESVEQHLLMTVIEAFMYTEYKDLPSTKEVMTFLTELFKVFGKADMMMASIGEIYCTGGTPDEINEVFTNFTSQNPQMFGHMVAQASRITSDLTLVRSMFPLIKQSLGKNPWFIKNVAVNIFKMFRYIPCTRRIMQRSLKFLVPIVDHIDASMRDMMTWFFINKNANTRVPDSREFTAVAKAETRTITFID